MDTLSGQLANVVPGEDMAPILERQEQILKKLSQTNKGLEAFNNFSASRFEGNSASIEAYTAMLLAMKADLETVFKRVRALKAKVAAANPQIYAQVQEENRANKGGGIEEDDDD